MLAGQQRTSWNESFQVLDVTIVKRLWTSHRYDSQGAVQDALQTGSNILFADMDIAWLQDPLLPLEARGGADLLLTDDGWGPNIGVMYVRPTQCTRLFMEDWLARRSSPEARDQYEFVAAVESAKKKCPTFRVRLASAFCPGDRTVPYPYGGGLCGSLIGGDCLSLCASLP